MAALSGMMRTTGSIFLLGASACSASSDGSLPPGYGSAGAASQPGGGASGASSSSGGSGTGVGGEIVFANGGALSASGGAPSSAGGATGAGSCGVVPSDTAVAEQCDNGLDDNLDGFIDEKCTCALGTTQPCFSGAPSQAALPNCHQGTQTCRGSPEFPGWGPCVGSGCGAVELSEVCDNGGDDDCDGLVDEGCYFDADVNIDGDCIGIPCPPQAPTPVGCDIQMEGGDSRGCVAHAAGNSAVYFQEGNACPLFPGCPICGDAGHISGKLQCSSKLDAVVLDATNCAINKPEPTYTDNPNGCPK